MATPLRDRQRYTVQDYMAWDDGERWELIDGEAYNMSPAPNTRHQRIAGEIHRQLKNMLSGHPCQVFIAPTDVVLSEYDVVQPDVLVVCDSAKVTYANIQGAPDLVFEVLSPSTSVKDRREKKALFERSGVKEYVAVHIAEEFVEVWRLENGKYADSSTIGAKEELHLASLDLTLDLNQVFELPPPPVPGRPPPSVRP